MLGVRPAAHVVGHARQSPQALLRLASHHLDPLKTKERRRWLAYPDAAEGVGACSRDPRLRPQDSNCDRRFAIRSGRRVGNTHGAVSRRLSSPSQVRIASSPQIHNFGVSVGYPEAETRPLALEGVVPVRPRTTVRTHPRASLRRGRAVGTSPGFRSRIASLRSTPRRQCPRLIRSRTGQAIGARNPLPPSFRSASISAKRNPTIELTGGKGD